MRNDGMTRLEAAREWVNGFNAVSTSMIAKLWNADPDDWHEVTRPVKGNRVYAYNIGKGELIKADYKDRLYRVKLDSGSTTWLDEDHVEVERYDGLPMWGTMWSFGDSFDNYWLCEKDGIAVMSQCGFRIFESDEFGYFFGIDGAGYDFYEAHWLPLY